MKRVWAEFEKTLWKNRQIEDKLHDTVCAEYKDRPGVWCRCKTKQQEMADWDSWVIANYRPPLVAAKSSGWADD